MKSRARREITLCLFLAFLLQSVGYEVLAAGREPVGGSGTAWADQSALTNVATIKTKIRGTHVLELRTAIDAKRLACGLPAYVWTNSLASSSVKVRALDSTEMRTALNQAYTAAGQSAVSYTPSTLTPRTVKISASHVLTLRQAVDALVCNPNQNGQCGPSNGAVFSSAPTSGLCNVGSPTAVTGSNPFWTWSCSGTGTGSSVSCTTAVITTARCGSVHGTTVSSVPSTNLCSVGSASTPTVWNQGLYAEAGWSCVVNAYDHVYCSAMGSRCPDTATWSVGGRTCTGAADTYFREVVYRQAELWPGLTGAATYACNFNGTHSGPVTASCEPTKPAQCRNFSRHIWSAAGCSAAGTESGWSEHGTRLDLVIDESTNPSCPIGSVMPIVCTNGTWRNF